VETLDFRDNISRIILGKVLISILEAFIAVTAGTLASKLPQK